MGEHIAAASARNAKNLIFGLSLVAVGFLFLLNGWDSFTDLLYLKWWFYVAGYIALTGIIDILIGRTPKLIAKGCFHLIIAFWIFASMEHLWGWTFRTSWPLILIAVGVQGIVSGLLSSPKQP